MTPYLAYAIFNVQKKAAGDRTTAGCVAMPQPRMRWLLRWLDPAAAPVVVMGPRAAISRM